MSSKNRLDKDLVLNFSVHFVVVLILRAVSLSRVYQLLEEKVQLMTEPELNINGVLLGLKLVNLVNEDMHTSFCAVK